MISLQKSLSRFNWILISLFLFILACREQPSQPEITPVALKISAEAAEITSGSSLNFKAVAHLSNGDSNIVTTAVSWSNQPGIAGQVQPGGVFFSASNKTGVETVQADYEGLRATQQISVTARASSFVILPANTNLVSGATLQLEASANFEDNSNAFVNEKVRWSISPGAAATIDNTGRVQALPGMVGQETVFAGFQHLSASSKITVQAGLQLPFEMATIPAGSFIMGSNSGPNDERPEHQVQIEAFQIGKYEITNAQYAEFLNQSLARGDIIYESGIVTARRGPFAFLAYFKICPTQDFPEALIQYIQIENNFYEFRAQPGYENYPMARLTWYGAAAFCAFYGLRLPTEAEWEKAGRGGQQLAYGTQDGTLSHELANYAGAGGRDTFERLAPVGSFPPNPYGLYDMCGNAAEYVFDIHDAGYYAVSPALNPIGPGPARPLGRLMLSGESVSTVTRGGSWIDGPLFCRASSRNPLPEDRFDQCLLNLAAGGFRVARSLP